MLYYLILLKKKITSWHIKKCNLFVLFIWASESLFFAVYLMTDVNRMNDVLFSNAHMSLINWPLLYIYIYISSHIRKKLRTRTRTHTHTHTDEYPIVLFEILNSATITTDQVCWVAWLNIFNGFSFQA